MSRSIIIFGGDGFIGTHFKSFLSSHSGLKVYSFDLKSKKEFLDVRQRIELDEEFSSDDIIINLAAVHTTPGHPDYEYFETNILGANNVCDFAERNGIDNIIFTSSIAPYGASESLKEENTLPTPNTPYGISKLVAEGIHEKWAVKSSKRKLLILRPGVVFGKEENGNFTRLASAITKGLFLYPGRKDTIKANIYVKELVYQSWEILNNQKENIEKFNFAYYPSKNIEEICVELANVLNKKQPSILIPAFLLKIVAQVLGGIGFKKLGIHPDRVKKLMTSTNISGKKLHEKIEGKYKYTFEEALKDWYEDCSRGGLY